MKSKLLAKLHLALHRKISSESDLIYILSRIRKLLELDKKERQFKVLKFYCDWALHAEIENIAPVQEFVDKIIKDRDETLPNFILTYEIFHSELERFLKQYDIPKLTFFQQRQRVNTLLSEIYSDTPLIVKTIQKKKLTWQSWRGYSFGALGKQIETHGGSFKIEDVS